MQKIEAHELESLRSCLLQIEEAYNTVADLDWKVSKSKHIITKYKDLVVKMQLQLNSKDYKVQAIKQERDKYLKSHHELKDHIMALQRSFQTQ